MNRTDTDWHTAGTRDWDLTVITGTHDDDHPDSEAARDERDQIRASIPNLNADQLRDYLNAILDQIEIHIWLDGPDPERDDIR